MNSLLYEFIYLKTKKNKIPAWGSNHASPNSTHFAMPPPTCLYYMILMSEEMTSQTITDEFIYVSV
jgi:hypothetical protein